MDDELDIDKELSDDDLLDVLKDTLGEGFGEEEVVQEDIVDSDVGQEEIQFESPSDIEEDNIFDSIEKDINFLNEGITEGLDIATEDNEIPEDIVEDVEEIVDKDDTVDDINDGDSKDEDNNLDTSEALEEDESNIENDDKIDTNNTLNDNVAKEEDTKEEDTKEEDTKEEEVIKNAKLPLLTSILNIVKSKFKFKINYTKTTAIMIVSLILLVIIGGIFTVIFIRSSQSLDLEEFNLDSTIVIDSFTSGSNNSNFIFIGETRTLGNNQFTLSRLLIDQTSTIFYFRENINWENYSISLVDNNGKNYLVSNSYFVNDNISDTISFEPLDTGIRGIILTIKNNETGEEEQFSIRFDSRIRINPALYINNRVTVIDEENYNLVLQGGTFSTAGISIYYYLNVSNNESIYFSDVSIIQGSQIIPNNNHLSYNIEGENSYIGRLDFPAVRNMNSNISMRFENVFTVHTLDMEIPLQGLFRNTLEDQVQILAGDNTVVLERIGRRGEEYILVLHGIDEYGERIETRLNANLKYTNSIGEDVLLKATTRSQTRGTDMTFNVNQFDNNNEPGQLSTFVLHIEDVLFIQEDVLLSMPADNLQRFINPSTERVINQGKDILKDQGYTNVELITYKIDNYDFIGVYSVRYDDIVSEYFVSGSRESSLWNLTPSLIQ